MKKIKIISFALILGLLIVTGCENKKEESNNNDKKNTPYEMNVTIEPIRIYDPEGNLIAEDKTEMIQGYIIEQDNKIIELEIKTEGEKKFLVINGKKEGKAKISVYKFEKETNECTSESSIEFKVDSNLNVIAGAMSANIGSCEEDISNVSLIK